VKIEGSVKSVGTPATGESRPRATTNGSKPAAVAGEKVELSSLSSSLARAETAMANTPTVNRARVDEIRQAISEGRFKVDAGRIADGLIEDVRQMLASKGQHS